MRETLLLFTVLTEYCSSSCLFANVFKKIISVVIYTSNLFCFYHKTDSVIMTSKNSHPRLFLNTFMYLQVFRHGET